MASVAMEALITDTQRFSVHDGPGIRTTVFFKGCPLTCAWCHNPESISFQNEPVFTRSDCIGCGACVAACQSGVLSLAPGGVTARRDRCTACLACAEACPSGACAPAARSRSARDLLDLVLADEDFYGDDGGVTLSGGEPLAHGPFLAEFLPLARAAGLHVAAQTSGLWSTEKVAPLLPLLDLVLYDVKVVDPQRHRQLTGRSNDRVLHNLRRLVEGDGPAVEVRLPLIGGCNTDPANIQATGRLLAGLGIEAATLLVYHRLGEGKWDQLRRPGLVRPRVEAYRPDEGEVEQVRRILTALGVEVRLA